MIKFKHHGDFKKTTTFLGRIRDLYYMRILEKYGKLGVEALSAATPVDSGETADSWAYEIIETKDGYKIAFNNTHTNDGVNIALLLQYGHATRNGTFVEGRDFINPAIQPIFDEIVEDVWKEVRSS